MMDHESATRRSGSAALEFVMCLPILLTLFLAIIWLGLAFVAQMEVTVVGRNSAWNQREILNDSGVVAKSRSLRFEQDGFVSGEAAEKVELGPLFVSFNQPRYEHFIIGDAWADTRFNQQLNRPRYLHLPLSRKAYWTAGDTLVKNYGDQLGSLGSRFQTFKADTLDAGKLDQIKWEQILANKLVDSLEGSVGWDLDEAFDQMAKARKKFEEFRAKVIDIHDRLAARYNGLPVGVVVPGLSQAVDALALVIDELNRLEGLLKQFESLIPGRDNEAVPAEVVPR